MKGKSLLERSLTRGIGVDAQKFVARAGITLIVVAFLLAVLLYAPKGMVQKSETPQAAQSGFATSVPVALSLSPPLQDTVTGTILALTLDASATELSGCDLTLSYDPTILEFQSATAAAFLATGGTPYFSAEATAGTLRLITARTGAEPASGSGTLATLAFHVIAPGSAAIGFTAVQCVDSQNAPLEYTAEGATVGVTGEAVPANIPSASPGEITVPLQEPIAPAEELPPEPTPLVTNLEFTPSTFCGSSLSPCHITSAQQVGVGQTDRVAIDAPVIVDAGAEIVIGSHPHVVEESELYRDKYIYYSLGNFIFDQYWNDDVRRGLLLKVWFTENGVARVQEIPIQLERDGRTCVVSE